MSIVEEEADETVYWIELLIDAGIVQLTRVTDLLKEADEILSSPSPRSKPRRDWKKPNL
jgi:hypothetical protein